MSDNETQELLGEMVRALIEDDLVPHPAEASMTGRWL